MYDELIQYNTANSFIEYTAHSAKYLKENNYSDDPAIGERLIELGAEDGEKIIVDSKAEVEANRTYIMSELGKIKLNELKQLSDGKEQ